MEKINSIGAVGSWVLSLIKYWIVLVILFQLSRFVFLLFNWQDVRAIGAKDALLACLYGLRMDMSMATYLMLPFVFITLLSVGIKPLRKHKIFQVYTGIILITILILLIIDVNMYKAWGFRLDATPLKYLSHPREALASIQHLPLIWISLFLIVAGFFIIRINNSVLKKIMSGISHSANKALVVVSILFLLAIAIIPLRGGFQLAPLNQSSVYFSSNEFANQAALNGPWNLLYSLTRSANKNENPFATFAKQEADSVTNKLFATNSIAERFTRFDPLTKPNLIIVIWEGLTAKAIDLQLEGKAVLPRFNSLKNEGIYFSNMYASGDRTDKGLVAVLSGYPSNPKESIVKSPVKAAKLPMLSKVFAKDKYHTSFYYGGETEFANMKAYLLQGGFNKIISAEDFETDELNSKWGAHDEIVMNKLSADLNTAPQPFFATWLTLSSHEPFEVPVPSAFTGKDEESLYLNSLHYTDYVFGTFIDKMKSSPFWNNTVILVVADHGSRMPKVAFKADDFKIGALILGGPVKQSRVVSRIGGQVDLATTLMHEFGYNETIFPWSRNLLDTSSQAWSLFSFNNGFGYAEPLGTIIYDNVGKLIVQKSGTPGKTQLRRGQALQQLIYQDYLDK